MSEVFISVVIPNLNEGEALIGLVEQLLAGDGADKVEVIVVDGGSDLNNLQPLLDLGTIKLIQTTPPRSNQLNAGAAEAKGEVLFFLHGDSLVSRPWKEEIEGVLALPEVVAGAFRFKLDTAGFAFRFLEFGVSLRCKFKKMPYGDQGLFLRRNDFEKLGGFKAISLMEDFEIIESLKKLGQIAISPLPLVTSARRFKKLGVLKSVWVNAQVVKRYKSGESSESLRNYYRSWVE